MSKSKLRNQSGCTNCVICTKVSKMHEYNNISDLLNKVEIWDTDIFTQYKKVKLIYKCLICNFATHLFNVWKCHIMSIPHLESSHKIKNLQSHVCAERDCKLIIYGTKSSINLIKRKNSIRSEGNTLGIPILMSEVMNRFLHNKHQLLYFCSHCKKFEDTPMHAYDKELVTCIKTLYDYFCKFCKVQFFSSLEMIDLHSLTVEHLTLKCFDHLCSTAKMNPKKIKLSEQLDPPNKTEKITIDQNFVDIQLPNKLNPKKIKLSEQLDPTNKTEMLTIDQNFVDIPLPNKPEIIINRFKSTHNGFGECKLCGSSVIWNIKYLVSHLSNCQYYYNITDLSNINISMYTFKCTLCNYSTADITNHTKHIISAQHIVSCYRTKNNYSYFCMECNLFMYSNKLAISHHLAVFHNICILKNFTLSVFMASIFNDINTNPNKTDIVPYHSINQDSRASSKVSFLCCTCKIEFHTSVDDYNIHMITSEHILLKFVSPNTPATKENNGVTTVITPAIKPIVIDPVQKNDSIKILKTDSKEHENNALVNKKSINLDDKGIPPPLVDVKELQILPIKNVLSDKSYENALNGSIESNSDIKLTLGHKQLCNQYTKYFKHKMKLLNLLRQYKDRVLNTLSYYCIECDIMCEEKPIWDKHNEAKHTNHSTRPTVLCSTCSMLIVGENANNHNKTIEHCVLLTFIQSLKPIEEDLIKETTKMEYVKSPTSKGTETEKEQPDVDIVGSTKEIFECQYPIENIISNIGIYNIQKSSILNDTVTKNTSLPKDKDVDQNKYEINLSASNPVKRLKEIKMNRSLSTSTPPTTLLHQTNVELKKQENMHGMDVLKNKDDGQCEHEVDKTIVCDPVKLHENTSSSNSLNVQVKVENQTNAEVKKHKALNLVKNKIIPEKVANDKSQNEVDSLSDKTTLSLDLPTETLTLVRDKKTSCFNNNDSTECTELTFKNAIVQQDDTQSKLLNLSENPKPKKEINKNKMNLSVSNPVKIFNEIAISPSHFTSTPPTTVLNQTNVELNKQENMNFMDHIIIKDDGHSDHEVDSTIVFDVAKLPKNTSTPSNSLNVSVNSSNSVSIPATVLHQTDADMKKHEEKTNKVFFLPTCDSDLYKEEINLVENKIISEKMADDRSQNEVGSISDKTALSLDLPTEVSTLVKNKESSHFYFGDYGECTELTFKNTVVQPDDTQSKLLNLAENQTPKEEIISDKSHYQVTSISSKEIQLIDSSLITVMKPPENEKAGELDNETAVALEHKTLEIPGKQQFPQAETKIMPEDIDMEPHNHVASLFNQLTGSLLAHVSKIFKTKQDNVLTDEDKAYGNYIITRLKYFKDKAVKRDIKLKTLDFLKSNFIPEQILSGTSKNIALSSDPALTNVSNENIDRLDIDEDSEYGQYVTQKLGNIKNQELKHNIKLEIDNIFYTNMRLSTIIP